jgi:Protein of unknown function (DUF3102)
MSGKPRSAYQKPGRPRPAMPTAQERMERKRQAKEQPKTNYYQIQKYAALRYDYSAIDGEQRQAVMDAALEIHKWQRNTIEIGKTLLAVKGLLPYGQFEDWWQTEFGLSERMVQSLLTVARVYGDASNPRRVAGLSDGALYLLAAPSTPEAARAEVEQLVIQGNAPRRAQVKQIIDAHKPARPARLLKPKQLPPPPVPQLTGPVAEPEPDDAIDAEYTVIAPMPEPLTFAAWLAAMPSDLSLAEQLAILALAKTTALHALGDYPKLYNAVYGALPTWSHLIHEIEKRLKTDE